MKSAYRALLRGLLSAVVAIGFLLMGQRAFADNAGAEKHFETALQPAQTVSLSGSYTARRPDF